MAKKINTSTIIEMQDKSLGTFFSRLEECTFAYHPFRMLQLRLLPWSFQPFLLTCSSLPLTLKWSFMIFTKGITVRNFLMMQIIHRLNQTPANYQERKTSHCHSNYHTTEPLLSKFKILLEIQTYHLYLHHEHLNTNTPFLFLFCTPLFLEFFLLGQFYLLHLHLERQKLNTTQSLITITY